MMRSAMPHPTPLRLLLALGLAFVPAFAAKPKSEPADAAPQLISTKGPKPKWTTVEQLKQFAEKGDPQACFELGDRHLEGDGVPRDVTKAAALFEQAAKGGIANAWFRLGKIQHDGLAGEADYGRALGYFTQAARLGVSEAQHNIGAMLVSARGVRRDYIEGLAWLIVAKKSGAPSDAETQVRTRLARRPADITAAEARAQEILADLPHAEARAVLPGAKPLPRAEPKLPPPPVVPATPSAPVVKPEVVTPKIDPPKIEMSLPKG